LKNGDLYLDELNNYPLNSPTHATKGTLSQFVLGEANDNSYIVNYNGSACIEINNEYSPIAIDGLNATSNLVKIISKSAIKRDLYIL
jgi:hypothetical protein